ncbi:MAG: 30S ribosomal protein S4 [Chitinivibrionales bacterium]|nr:30S ribosomal protein S4 [Chitinivibrionales bacterium]
MSRNLAPKGKIVRRFGLNIFGNPKYDRLLERRPTPPGETKKHRTRLSEYGKQLAEKQKIRFSYGLSERQFRILFEKARKIKGSTGDNMISLLERRLDNVIYRLGMAATRNQGRQIVNHSHILVNKKTVNIASYFVEANDVISIRNKEGSKKMISEFIANSISRDVPQWLTLSKVDMTGTVTRLPEKTDCTPVGNEVMVVELYSK